VRIAMSNAHLNRTAVLDFYRLAFEHRQPADAFMRFAAPDFIEHKPDIANPTREGTAAFLEGLMREMPGASWEVVRTIAEGDLVFLHNRFVPAPGAAPYAIADIFRVRDGLIVEHWDVVAGPAANPRNPSSRF
jgi:predicted SnoaL-like aldol condensation-catalyzing enzyme